MHGMQKKDNVKGERRIMFLVFANAPEVDEGDHHHRHEHLNPSDRMTVLYISHNLEQLVCIQINCKLQNKCIRWKYAFMAVFYHLLIAYVGGCMWY